MGLGSFSRESVLYLGLSDLRSGGRSNGVCSSVLSMLLGSIVIVPRFLCFPSLLSLNPTYSLTKRRSLLLPQTHCVLVAFRGVRFRVQITCPAVLLLLPLPSLLLMGVWRTL